MGSTGIAPRRAVLLGLLIVLAGCGGGSSSPSEATDPSVVVVESENLASVSSDSCHVQGTVLNGSDTVTFDLTLRWQAFDAADKSLGTTSVRIDRLGPGERRAYDATGFASNDKGLVPCSKIARFERISTTVSVH